MTNTMKLALAGHTYDVWEPNANRWIVIEDDGILYDVTPNADGTLGAYDRGSDTRLETLARIVAAVEAYEALR